MFKTIVRMFGVKGEFTHEYADRHNAKSAAGKAIHKNDVRSVCVADESGKVEMYFNKTGDKKNWVIPEKKATAK
jgi:hypothetical protein